MRSYNPEIASAHQRAAQEDPWIMYLIVRKDFTGSSEDLLVEVARAALQAERVFAEDPEHLDAFNSWWDESFRKVCLKATTAHWQVLAEELPSVVNGAVLACVPFQRSQASKLLKKQQVLTSMDLSENRPKAALLTYWMLEDMSLGKQAAQIAHAALKFSVEHQIDPQLLAALPAQVIFCADPAEADTSDCLVSEIQDAGLTEVEAGTLTAVATLPKED